MPLAMRTDVIDQILAMALLHPRITITSVTMIVCLTHSPETHAYIARKEVVKCMLEICEQKYNDQSSHTQQDPLLVNSLKYVAVLPFLCYLSSLLILHLHVYHAISIPYIPRCYTSIALAQIGLGSLHLLVEHLQHRILNLMSDMLEAASPADMCLYETKIGIIWDTFLPYLQYLYKPSNVIDDTGGIKTNLHVTCCNVLLHGLETALGSDRNLKFMLKEGLLDYTMCLPAVLRGECQPRARSLVNELGKHRQLQPPSLCTLAKAHVAKTFCGLQPVMEMNSIGEFLNKYFPAS